ncbi:hypothetical protein GF343_01400 [Candidatus Woesearchaeota archaeon]|nr:hypothetical protein [Candidatus Woesearchaeota archaeon]
MKKRTRKRLEVFLEFLIFGIVLGITEDLLAIWFATDAHITWHLFVIVLAITIPFAIIGELIVDNIKWFGWIRKQAKNGAKHLK